MVVAGRILTPESGRLLGARIFGRRTTRGLSWTLLSDRCGLAVVTLRRVEAGRGRLTSSGFERLARYLNSSPAQLLEGLDFEDGSEDGEREGDESVPSLEL